MVNLRRLTNIKFTKITTENYFTWIIISLGVLYLVFNTKLATIYHIILGADFILYYFNYRNDKVIQFPLERRTDNRLKSLVTAVIAYGVFLIISTVLVKLVAPMSVAGVGDYMSIIKLMSTSVPIFAGSLVLSEYAFGMMIPTVESSLFFGRLLEKIISVIERRTGVKVSLEHPSASLVFAVLFCMAFFVIYHLGSKGLANVPLLVTGVFAVISCILVLKDKELKSCILLHVISNSIVILSAFKFF